LFGGLSYDPVPDEACFSKRSRARLQRSDQPHIQIPINNIGILKSATAHWKAFAGRFGSYDPGCNFRFRSPRTRGADCGIENSSMRIQNCFKYTQITLLLQSKSEFDNGTVCF
jgi:hypothetical protein